MFDTVRSVLPTMDLDSAFEAKEEIATAVKDSLAETMADFGFSIQGCLVTDLNPDGARADADAAAAPCAAAPGSVVGDVERRQRGLSGVDGVVSVGAGALPARRAAFYLSPFTSPTFTPPSAHPVDLLTPAARVLRPTLPAKVKSAMNQINEATRMREANKERAEADKIQLVKVA